MKYTLTIKDNETGEIVKTIDCDAIIAGLSLEGKESCSLVITNCSNKKLFCACMSASEAIDNALENEPELKAMYLMGQIVRKKMEGYKDE